MAYVNQEEKNWLANDLQSAKQSGDQARIDAANGAIQEAVARSVSGQFPVAN